MVTQLRSLVQMTTGRAVPPQRTTIMAAARDDLGRLRVLDGGGVDVYLDSHDSGMFVGEDSP